MRHYLRKGTEGTECGNFLYWTNSGAICRQEYEVSAQRQDTLQRRLRTAVDEAAQLQAQVRNCFLLQVLQFYS